MAGPALGAGLSQSTVPGSSASDPRAPSTVLDSLSDGLLDGVTSLSQPHRPQQAICNVDGSQMPRRRMATECVGNCWASPRRDSLGKLNVSGVGVDGGHKDLSSHCLRGLSACRRNK